MILLKVFFSKMCWIYYLIFFTLDRSLVAYCTIVGHYERLKMKLYEITELTRLPEDLPTTDLYRCSK